MRDSGALVPGNLRYVPVARYRQEEVGALRAVVRSPRVLPLIEIIKRQPRADRTGEFGDAYASRLAALGTPLIIDFPTYVRLTGATNDAVASFLGPVQRDPARRVDLFRALAPVPGLIPTVTYTPRMPYPAGILVELATGLRPMFDTLAFRLFPRQFPEAYEETLRVARAGDIVLLDLEGSHHANPALRPFIAQVLRLPCRRVIIRAAIDENLRNLDLTDDVPIAEADNSLLSDYDALGFDAFGDFAGIKKDLLRDGGTISPGFIFYSWPTNSYVGYRGRTRALTQFAEHIAPTVLRSQYHRLLSEQHKEECPGCVMIRNIARGQESGAHQGKWKRIAMSHYLYTMGERL